MLIVLERAVPHCRIHAQVAMGALLKAPTNPLRKAQHSDRDAFSQKIVDFVAQDRATVRSSPSSKSIITATTRLGISRALPSPAMPVMVFEKMQQKLPAPPSFASPP